MKNQTQLTTLPASAPSANGSRQENFSADPAIAGYLAAYDRLRQRERELEADLANIRQLLNGKTEVVPPITPPPPLPNPPSAPPVPPAVETRRSNTGLSQAVIDLIKQHGPLTKDQLVPLLVDQKFPFFGKPKPALDPVLYSKKFKRDGKTFSLAVETAAQSR